MLRGHDGYYLNGWEGGGEREGVCGGVGGMGCCLTGKEREGERGGLERMVRISEDEAGL